MREIKMKKVFALSVFTMLSITLFAQNTVEEKTEVITSTAIQEVSVSTDIKYTPETFYIINEKPVSREEYMKHLDAKKEETNSTPQ